MPRRAQLQAMAGITPLQTVPNAVLQETYLNHQPVALMT